MTLRTTGVATGRSLTILAAVSMMFVLLLSGLDWWTYPRVAVNNYRDFLVLVASLAQSGQMPTKGSSLGMSSRPATAAQEARMRPSFPEADSFYVIGRSMFAGRSAGIFRAAEGDVTIGYAIDGYAEGYHGVIHSFVATDPDFNVTSVEVLDHTETEGYSDRFEAKGFLHQFLGKSGESLRLGKGIDAVSGATISCRAVAEGAASSVEYLQKFIAGGGTKQGAELAEIPTTQPLTAPATAEEDSFGGKDGALSLWHKDKGVGCQLCHIEKRPPYSSYVPTKTCLECHKNGFSDQSDGEKMLAEIQQRLAAAPGGRMILAAADENFPPAHDLSNPTVALRLQYRAIRDIEDARPKWAERAIYQGQPSDPHISHIPISNCTTCHHVHRQSEDQCGTPTCHPNFTYKMR